MKKNATQIMIFFPHLMWAENNKCTCKDTFLENHRETDKCVLNVFFLISKIFVRKLNDLIDKSLMVTLKPRNVSGY